MECPVCHETLQITDRQGVEVDYCPKCRGVWLDRGELDKLIERSSSRPVPVSRRRDYDSDYPNGHSDDRYNSESHHGKPKKKKSWLGEFFEFD